MASELQILGFERVTITKKGLTKISRKDEAALKNIPNIPCCAEVSLQEISFWRTKPKDRHYGAHSMSVDLDSTSKPTKVKCTVELRDQKERNDTWAYRVRALVIYYKK